jgi:RNA polymerase sigma factor (sigma-70 family)
MGSSGWKTKVKAHDESGPSDELLVRKARQGDQDAVSALVKRYQDRIYNLTLRMTGNPVDAEDRTQEILVKLITGLSSFKHKSSFATWLFRIVVNHNINAKKTAWEKYFHSFDDIEKLKTNMKQTKIDASTHSEVEKKVFLEEMKNGCLTSMLLCLDRMQRIVVITGSIFNLDSATAARILDMTPANFRQIHSRARKQLSLYMNSACSLLNPGSSCRCDDKMNAAIKMGMTQRRKKRRQRESLGKISEFVSRNKTLVDDALELRMQNIFRELPYYKSPVFDGLIKHILNRPEVKKVINFSLEREDEQKSG